MPKDKKPDKNETSEKTMNRRQFLVGGSAALAAGAIAATTGVKSAAAAEPESYPESKGYLVYDQQKMYRLYNMYAELLHGPLWRAKTCRSPESR